MRILIAPDSFKDALSAAQVANHIGSGLKAASSDFLLELLPMADGGEGSAKLVCDVLGGKWILQETVDPLLRPIQAGFAWLPDSETAIVEVAEAAGLQRLKSGERNPMETSSFGTGLQMKQALEMGAKKLILTLGGSSTQDSGTGIASALGFRFFADGYQIQHPKGRDLSKITQILQPENDLLGSCEITALCDVDNPLLGSRGTATIYAPQKGADSAMVKSIEAGNENIANLVSGFLGEDIHHHPGAGAAGGIGFGAMAFLRAMLAPGAQKLMEILHFEEKLKQCDWLITGEGKIDHQTASGKLLAAQTAIARNSGVGVIAICGHADITPKEIEAIGFTAVFPLGNGTRDIETALAETANDLERVAYQLGKLLSSK